MLTQLQQLFPSRGATRRVVGVGALAFFALCLSAASALAPHSAWLEIATLGAVTVLALALARQTAARQRSENALAEAQRHLQTSSLRLDLVDAAAGLGCWDYDLTTGLTVANSQQFQLLGLPQTEYLLREQFLERVHPSDVGDLFEQERAILASGRSDMHQQFRVLLPSGEIRWIFVKGQVFRNDEGVPVRLTGVTLDVSALKAAQAAVQDREERFRAVFAGAAITMAVSDLQGKFLEFNQSCCYMTGYSRDEMLNRDFRSLLHPEDLEGHQERMAALVRGELPSYVRESRVLRKDGSEFWIRMSVSLLHENGRPAGFIGLCEDINERKTAEQKLEYQRTHDLATGLKNRRTFVEQLRTSIESRRHGAVLYVHLSGAAAVNATLGHSAGDQLIAHAAERVLECSVGATVGRFATDEFAVLIETDDGEEAAAAQLARTLLSSICVPFILDNSEWELIAAIGISLFPGDAATAASVLQQADAAMSAARSMGPNHWLRYSPEHGAARRDRIELETALRGATARGEVEVVYQPEFDLRTGHLMRFEALSRWHHPRFGPVSPARFIPVAEDTGIIVQIGEWVLRAACQRAAVWNAELAYPPVGVAVNVSTVQFLRDDFVEMVFAVLSDTGLDPALLQLELTESVAMPGFEACAARMTTLRDAGVSLALDDFGTGYSSLSYLRRLPFDGLKIDRSFVRDLDNDPTALAMIQTLLSLAHNFSMRVVVEGVETNSQLRSLQQIGCDEVQGYLLGRPCGDPERYFKSHASPQDGFGIHAPH